MRLVKALTATALCAAALLAGAGTAAADVEIGVPGTRLCTVISSFGLPIDLSVGGRGSQDDCVRIP